MNDLGGQSLAPAQEPTPEEKTMGLVAHLLGLFTCFIGPLVIYLIKKDESEFIKQSSMQALYWQIGMIVASIALGVITCLIGGVGAGLASVVNLVYVIIACIRANEGKIYSYPVTGGFVK